MAKEIERTHGLSVGDCLKSVWGYDQAEVDYYQVIALNGSSMITVREIAQDRKPSDHSSMTGVTSPIKDAFIGEPFLALDMGLGGIKLTALSYAVKCEWDDVSRWSS